MLLAPLAIGAAWWIGIAATHWNDDPLEFVVNSGSWSMSRELGGGTFVQGVLYDILGPLTCPLTLRGPYVLGGWNFLWTALSTTLAMLVFTGAACAMAAMQQRNMPLQWRWLAAAAIALIYVMPVLARTLY